VKARTFCTSSSTHHPDYLPQYSSTTGSVSLAISIVQDIVKAKNIPNDVPPSPLAFCIVKVIYEMVDVYRCADIVRHALFIFI
jgi:hypothetical protein